jgi:hypothetical protein
MNAFMTAKTTVLAPFIGILLLAVLGMAGPVTANEHLCNSKAELNFCIEGFETNKDTVIKGDVVEGEVSITNVGNKSGSVVIIVGLENSEDSYSYHRVGVLHDLTSGETHSYEFQLEAREDSTIGEHRINVRLMDMPEKHLYDSTGYTSSIYLEKDPISLGWIIEQFNSFTVGLSALIGILAYLFGRHRIGLK